MSAESLADQVRPVLAELSLRMRQTELECGQDALLWALYPMLETHREALHAETSEAKEWINALAVAILLIHPGWSPDDVSDALREAAALGVLEAE